MPDQNYASVENRHKLKVAWISNYPIEWMSGLPENLLRLRRQHPATWAVGLLEELQRMNNLDLHVLVLRNQIEHSISFARNGVTFHVIKASRMARLFSLFWYDVITIKSHLKSISPDLIHAWGTERAAALTASRLGCPYLVTVQGILEWIVKISPSVDAYTKIMAYLEPVSLRRARVATIESSFGKRYLSARYPNVNWLRIEHAPNRLFFDVPRTESVEGTRIIAIGTLGATKGSDLLLSSLDTLKDEFKFTATLIGDWTPSFLETMKSQTSVALWDRLKLKRNLTPQEVAFELSSSTLLVHPARVDNSPNAVKEAAVVGVPVVASAVGGIPEHILPDHNGLLFYTGNQSALTSALREALKHRMFSKGQVDEQTRTRIRKVLSPERMRDSFLKAYESTLNAWISSSTTRHQAV